MIKLHTNFGVISVELDTEKAPISAQNFLDYAEAGHFDNTIFHRVIPGFMVQGGGFEPGMKQKPCKAPIKNEADNGLLNQRGSVAMARTGVVDSATSQFFINSKDNDFLNHGGRDFGYAVFATVIKGMHVVDQISGVATGVHAASGMPDVPREPVIILDAKRI